MTRLRARRPSKIRLRPAELQVDQFPKVSVRLVPVKSRETNARFRPVFGPDNGDSTTRGQLDRQQRIEALSAGQVLTYGHPRIDRFHPVSHWSVSASRPPGDTHDDFPTYQFLWGYQRCSTRLPEERLNHLDDVLERDDTHHAPVFARLARYQQHVTSAGLETRYVSAANTSTWPM